MQRNINISVTQAAKILNSSGKTIINYCQKGKLRGKKNPVTGIWNIDFKSIQELLKNKRVKARDQK